MYLKNWAPYRTESCVPWLFTIDFTVYTKGVISSLATDPVYWQQFFSPPSVGSGKRLHQLYKAIASGRSQAATADSLMKSSCGLA